MLTVALVNNMPSSAFLDTEEQFRSVAANGLDADAIELFTFTEIDRDEPVAGHVRDRYHSLHELWNRPPDALIVTGTEPVQTELAYETYWPSLARLLQWAADAVPTVILSCLAAHAAVLLFDGIRRTPRAVKRCGVFAEAVEPAAGELTDGLPASVRVPHSRVNDVSAVEMRAAGYRILVGGRDPLDDGWSIATRRCGDSEFVFCQGHPEYTATSLLREYRRDIRRSLFGRGAVPFPEMPAGYFDATATRTLEAYAARAQAPDVNPRELFEEFPFDDVAAGIIDDWHDWAAVLYRNWLVRAEALVGGAA